MPSNGRLSSRWATKAATGQALSAEVNGPVRARAAALGAEHPGVGRDLRGAGDFWGGAGSMACRQFINDLGRNVPVICQRANDHGPHGLRGGIQLGLTAPIIPARPEGDASQQPYLWATAHTITCG